MKTSEFIRQAVDTYLAHGDDLDKYGYIAVIDKEKFLCSCMDNKRIGLITLSEAHGKAIQLINDIIADAATEGGLYPSSTLSGVGQNLGYWRKVSESKYELQEIRFMLAEFMALYFEDQGD